MSCQNHNGWVCSSSKVPNFNCVVSACSCYKVLVLIKVHTQNLVRMSMDSFDIFPWSQIPNSASLITGTRSENRLVSRMPNGCIHSKIMLESLLRSSVYWFGIPKFYCLIEWRCQNHALVNVIPLTTKYLTLMTLRWNNRSLLCSCEVPKFNTTVTTGRENLIPICLIKADVICRIWRLKRTRNFEAGLVCV